ncbi:MAG TPA: hypothetical protein PLO62_05015 [Candidatus Hydrogenedentes bacterium]|nr:hypothetical protein [Candidatus Hydrogenedentota bacterium]HOS04144.1 hypothetical protein [Candidatus Hydrogenedentota bacterium]
MSALHAKTIRRRLLQLLYDRFMQDPNDMLTPEDFLDGVEGLTRHELLSNAYYLHDRGFIELMMGYNPPMFAVARITANGIDIVENAFEFNLRFPPAPGETEAALASVPALMERLVNEADYAPLDGEERCRLLRDVQYLRDEISRPAVRWRRHVMESVLHWIGAGLDDVDATLPSLRELREALVAAIEDR